MASRNFIFLFLLLLLPPSALAHKPSDSYLILNPAAGTGRWDIALRDLEHAIGLDVDRNGLLTWGEVRARHPAIAAYVLARLTLSTDKGDCLLTPGAQQLVDHSDGTYTVLPLTLDCPAPGPLTVDYRLFFDLDPSHRGLLQVQHEGGSDTAILSPQRPALTLAVTGRPWTTVLAEYWQEGVWHIWIGFDHILFLMALLLPAVLWRDGDHWRAVTSLGSALKNIAAIVTAFTVAHSITLTLAVVGWLDLPARWVESAIALTVVVAALNNLYPLGWGRQWMIAFALGLIHGFGFAGVLTDLGLADGTMASALAGFNLGVETGQLAIVALFIPLAFVLRETWFYRQAVLRGGSLAVAGIALVWLLERSLGVVVLS
ncbi:HupE/UreJ family protein [Nitrosococcus watsonii]|uniref:HupE/UreJ protein n=1 Tax=Nitrosococcus watsoni (strain C-113) TaxID=105559 RepID=D8K4D6_NITWC|nr:HupE/UreJ family protein [Nitrosococcus watsonii]ADJ27833.1 conserved hypothetical protein [Nitrosococcus watsonii C-113]